MADAGQSIRGAGPIDRLQAMQVFVRVADNGGFAQAARQLHLSAPAVTRAVAAIEEALGTRLLVRTTRSVKLTEAGAVYLGDCKRILAEIAEAEASAAGSYGAPTGTLTVSAPMLFGRIYVMPILTAYLDRYPGVTARALFLDRVTHLVDEGIDVAVRIGHLPDSSFVAARVGFVRRVICGSPRYFSEHGVPREPADLLKHRVIAANAVWAPLDWRFGHEGKTVVHVKPTLACSTNDGAIGAALAGFGVTRVLSYQIAPDVEAGRLQTVLSEHEEERLPIHVVHPEGRRVSAKVRAFVDLAVERLRANPHIN